MSTYDPQVTELLTYFSSYLTDTTQAIADIKNLVYQLIEIQIPPARGINVPVGIYDVMAACKKTFEDLKRTQSILKGHLRAKQNRRYRSLSQPEFSRLQENQIEKDTCSRITFNFRQTVDSDNVIETPTVYRDKFESRTTRVSQPACDSQRKTPQDRHQTRFHHVSSRTLNCQTESLAEKRHEEPDSTMSRTRSTQILKKFENLRDSRNQCINSFQKETQECVSLLSKLKQQISSNQIKKKRRGQHHK